MSLLYTKNRKIGSLNSYFADFFQNQTKPTQHSLVNLLFAMLFLGPTASVRSMFKCFLKENSNSSLNSYYYTFANSHLQDKDLTQTLTKMALKVCKNLPNEPIFISCDDTLIEKSGEKFADVSILHDHAKHNGNLFMSGHDFVSLTMCVPVITKQNGISRIQYLSLPLGYKLWEKGSKSKFELAADLVDAFMSVDGMTKRQVILSVDSWYMKAPFIPRVMAYENLNLIGNVKKNSFMCELPEEVEHVVGRPKKYGKQIHMDDQDLAFTYTVGEYSVCHKVVVTKLFGDRLIQAYITKTASGSRRLFFSTLSPDELQISCAWQADPFLRQAGPEDYICYPLRLYSLRWNIEINYYEQKTFWSLGKYMLRSRTGISHMVNLINLLHCSMRLLPYLMPVFYGLRGKSAQEIRFVLSQEIQHEVIFGRLEVKAKRLKRSTLGQEALKKLFFKLLEAA